MLSKPHDCAAIFHEWEMRVPKILNPTRRDFTRGCGKQEVINPTIELNGVKTS